MSLANRTMWLDKERLFSGILALAPTNVWTIFFTRRTKTTIHWIMQAFGGAFAIIGIMAYEYSGRTAHFHSTHSKLGISRRRNQVLFKLFRLISNLQVLHHSCFLC